MCMTEDGDDLLETARRVQDTRRWKPGIIPVRDEAEVALAVLLDAISEADACVRNVVGLSFEAREQQRASYFVEIVRLKARYDAARLAKGDRTLPVIGLNVQTDALDDGLGGEIG